MRRLALLLALLAILPVYGAEVRPFPPYHETPANGILFPRIISPYLTVNGATLRVWVSRSAVSSPPSDLEILLESAFSPEGRYRAELVGTGEDPDVDAWWADFSIPEGVPRGLYNLTLRYGGGELTEPNSVFVFGPEYPDEIRILHVTDTHTGARLHPKYIRNNELLSRILAVANSIGVDLVIHTGDLVDAIAKTEEADPAFSQAYKMLCRLRVPVIAVQGNNDQVAIDKGLYTWEKYLGPLSGFVSAGPYLFLLVDSDTGKVPGEQFDLLENAPTASSGILLVHYPLEDKDAAVWVKKPEGGIERLNYSETILDLVREKGVPLVLVGHWHESQVWDYDGVEVVLTDAGQHDDPKVGDETVGGDFGHYRLLTIRSDGSFDLREVYSVSSWLDVKFLQPRISFGASMLVRNRGSDPATLHVPVVLSEYSDSPALENAEIEFSREHDGLGAYVLRVEIGPGEEKVVKISTKPDGEPPSVEVQAELDRGNVTLWASAVDEGLGVSSISYYWSTDNETWQEFPSYRDFGVSVYTMPMPADKIYYKVVAVDLAGNEGVAYGSVSRAKPEAPPAPEAAGPADYTVVIAAVIVVIVIAAAIFALKRKSS